MDRSLLDAVLTTDTRSAARQLEGESDQSIADLLTAINPGFAVEILSQFPPDRRERIAAATPFGDLRDLISRPALTSTVAPLVKLTGTNEEIAAALPAVLVSVPALLMLPPPVEEVMPMSDCRSNVAPTALLRMPEVFT